MRTLLVVSERPHPWALLRDRLDAELVRVAWIRPAQAAAAIAGSPSPWFVAAGGAPPPPGLGPPPGRLLQWAWVGHAPEASGHAILLRDWRELAAEVQRRLDACVGGVRLAPGCGVVLPDGSYLAPCPELEVLLAAHPDGLEPSGSRDGGRAAARRIGGMLGRRRLSLRVTRSGGRLALVEERRAGTA